MRYNEMRDTIVSLRTRLDQLERLVETDETPQHSFEHTVVSDSRGDVLHTVQKRWTCTCESFRYKTGLDYNGHCKHIRAVIATL